MIRSRHQFNVAAIRLVAAGLVAVMAFASSSALADRATRVDRTEARIVDMHTKLQITQDQKEQWDKVAQVMRDNAKEMDALLQARHEHADTMTAVDDLKSFGEVTDANAEGIKKLTPVFATLYGSMSDTQKKAADKFFRRGGKMMARHRGMSHHK